MCGILLYLDFIDSSQPGSTSIVGQTSFGADLSVYSSQINSIAGVPTITPQLGTQTVQAGNSVTFSVAATGFGTLTYQWYKNGVAITGATAASYTLSATSGGDAGDYTVAVTNPYGTTTSSAYTLTVSNPVPATPPWALALLALLVCLGSAWRLHPGESMR